MITNLYKDITNAIASDWTTVRQSLSQLSDGIDSEMVSTNNAFIAVSTAVSVLTAIPIEERDLSQQANRDKANDMLHEALKDNISTFNNAVPINGKAATLTGKNKLFFFHAATSEDPAYYEWQLGDADHTVYPIIRRKANDVSSFEFVPGWTSRWNAVFDRLSLYQEVLNEAAAGRGYSSYISDCCRYVASRRDTPVSDIVNGLQTLSENYTAISYDFKSQVLAAIINGPRAMLEFFRTYVSSVKQLLTDTSQTDVDLALPESTCHSYASFSCGLVLSTVVSIGTTVAMALLGVSRILAVVVGVVAAVADWGIRLVSNVQQSLAGTKFSVKSNGDHAFDFALFRGIMTDQRVANICRSFATNGFSYLHKPSATVWYFYLKAPGVLNDHRIGYEVHLSTDFDCSSNIDIAHGIQFKDGSTYSGYAGRLVFSVQGISRILAYTKDVPNASASTVLGHKTGMFFDCKSMETSGVDVNSLWRASYKPADIGLLSGFVSVLSDLYDVYSNIRLSSAVMVFTWWMIHQVILRLASEDFSSVAALGDPTSIYLYAPDRQYNADIADPSYWTAIDEHDPQRFALWLFGLAFSNLVWSFSTSVTTLSAPLTDPVWHASLAQELLSAISDCFDGFMLNVEHSYVSGQNTGGFIFPADETGGPYGGAYQHFITDSYYNRLGNFQTAMLAQASRPEIANDWPTEWGIELPSTLWSAFIAGLIVDGIVALAIATIIVGGVVAKMQINNYRARMQAEAEQQWYNYAEYADSAGATASQKKAVFKNYKVARMKYNLLAIATGGTALSLGMYDETDPGSFFSTVSSWLKGDESETPSDGSTINSVGQQLTNQGESIADLGQQLTDQDSDIADLKQNVSVLYKKITGDDLP